MKSSTATGTTATAEVAVAHRPRGRFAPSPTGRLHLGSLYAALGSYLDARHAAGEWWLRIEDVDRAREVPGAADEIQRALEAFGLHWDGPVLYQSTRTEAYAAALHSLSAAGRTYPCSCSRGDLAALAGTGVPEAEARYPGWCRAGPRRAGAPLALRLMVEPPAEIHFCDRLQGDYTQDVAATVGDFVLRRRDGLYAYQLAVVVDDAAQGITDVVRGLDLLDNTPRQRLLGAALGLSPPRMLHLPLLVDDDGAKLAKSRRALPVDPGRAPAVLGALLRALGLPPPSGLVGAPVGEQLAWAVGAWAPERLRGVTRIRAAEVT